MTYSPDPSQQRVIELPADARAHVEAGPGFGKTDVACARVASLVASGIEPTRILLLSFTRTAVREIRARIKELTARGVKTNGTEIRTLDSFAWRLRTGLSEVKKEGHGWGYEESIEEVVRMLEHPSDALSEYLGGFLHVFVDEAQDLVGARAKLVAAILDSLSPSCGYTVFIDPAQAIYGWADDGEGRPQGQAFSDLVRSLDPPPERYELTTLHRSSDRKLTELVLATRALILKEKSGPGSRPEQVRECIDRIFPEQGTDAVSVVKAIGPSDSMLVLFRSRFEAMRFSGSLSQENIAHRLRFGALPPVIAPWVALVMNRTSLLHLDRQEFNDIWKSLSVPGRWTTGWDPDHAWSLLRRMGAKGALQISVAAIADRLAMASPPDDLGLKEVGSSGPIVGTIHGSKGREAETVLACLPRAGTTEDEDACDEEARVLYVAVTRAKKSLHVLDGGPRVWTSRNGRAWRKTMKGSVQLEIGRSGDVDIGSVADEEVQARLELFDGKPLDVTSKGSRDSGWKRVITTQNGDVIGTLYAANGAPLMNDLWDISKFAWGEKAKPGNWIGHFRWFDVTTMACRADSPILNGVGARYRKTRVWLAPVFSGLGVMTQPWGKI